jgi:hypothetical protein
MKRLLTAAALALSLINPAFAEWHGQRPLVLYNNGVWRTYAMAANDGQPLCGMEINGQDRSMFVKVQLDGVLEVQLWKNTWRFPDDGVDVQLVVGFDKNEMVDATGRGVNKTTDNRSQGQIFFWLKDDVADGFLHEFGEADKMFVRFTQGNEQPWIANMKGSRDAANAFRNYLAAMRKNFTPPTQPYGDTPQASQPTQPTQPYSSASKKNDGGI